MGQVFGSAPFLLAREMTMNIEAPDSTDSRLAAANQDAPLNENAGGAIQEAGKLGKVIVALGHIFATGILLAAGILLLEVFLRYVFNRPTIWAHETTTFLCGIAFLYGGLFCVARNSHIRVVLLYDLLSQNLRRWFNVFISLVSLAASVFFALASYIMATKALFTPMGDFRLESSGSAWNPPTPAAVKVFLLAVLILMSIQFLILAVNYMRANAEGDNK